MKSLHTYLQITLFIMATSAWSLSPQSHYSEREAKTLLPLLHSQLNLDYGSFKDEYPEQIMAFMFISANDKVLELGGNIGRNSCVISSLLNDSRNLVVAETDYNIAAQLAHNRDLNNLSFHIENSAISKIPLIQTELATIPGNAELPGYFKVNTITYGELKNKYGVQFNVLVADCEGALYYIFKDDESILNDVSLIIVENDFLDILEYDDIHAKFLAHGFQLVYNKAGGWGPCYDKFYQVWKKL